MKTFQKRLVGLTLIAGLVAMALPVSVAAAQGRGGGGGGGGGTSGPSYQIYAMNTSDGAGGYWHGYARDINSNASPLVAGYVYPSENKSKASAWTVTKTSTGLRSQLHLLDDAGFEFARSTTFGCNAAGEIVGDISDADTFLEAVYWSSTSGQLEILPSAGFAEAYAINDQGIACGFSSGRALVWSRVDGEWQKLELTPLGDPGTDTQGNPLPDRFVANDLTNVDPISHSLLVVGGSNDRAAVWQVFVNPDTNALTAGPAMILPSAGYGTANAVNNSGAVAGSALLDPSSYGEGVVWIDGQVQALARTPPPKPYNTAPRRSVPDDISDAGLLVGDDGFRAVIWPDKDSATIVLADFLSKNKNAPFTGLERAVAANASGEIVGNGWNYNTGMHTPFFAIPSSN